LNRKIVVSAIEDAMVVAARKYYKSEEDLRGKFNQESGVVDVFAVLTVVEEVADPKREIALADARKKNLKQKSARNFVPTNRRMSSAASPRKPPNRSSFKKCAKPSATQFSMNTTTASANSSPLS